MSGAKACASRYHPNYPRIKGDILSHPVTGMGRSAPRGPLQSGGLAAWTRGFHRPPLAEEPSRRAGFFTAFAVVNSSYYNVFAAFVNANSSSDRRNQIHFVTSARSSFRKGCVSGLHTSNWLHAIFKDFSRTAIFFPLLHHIVF